MILERRLRIAILIGALGFQGALATPQSSVQRTSDKLHPHMRQLLQERGPAKGWIFFADKGHSGPGALQNALREHVRELEPRTLERRKLRRQRPGLVDYDDLPVADVYTERVLAEGVRLSVESSWLNAISVTGTERQFEAIAALSFVDRIEPVRRGVLTDGSGGPARDRYAGLGRQAGGAARAAAGFYGDSEDQLEQINLIDVHQRGFTGAGIVIGVLDTGFHRGHEAFNQPGHVLDVVAEWDFVDGDANTGIDPGDDVSQHNHGTWILGTLGSYLPNELVGAAYDASYILAKTEDVTDEYQQEEDFYVAGLQFIEANGGDIATSSLGYIDWYTQADLDGLTAVTTIGVNVATANGLFCCTAAGNSGHDSNPSTSALIAPADAFDVITVGAVDFAGVTASFSSDGPTADGRLKPEVLAWGVSTWTVCSTSDTNCTTAVNGTSLSTPLVAGLMACLIQAHPNWSVQTLRTRVLHSGGDFRATGKTDPLFVRGFGVPDADLAGFGDLIRPGAAPAGSVSLPLTVKRGPILGGALELDLVAPAGTPPGALPFALLEGEQGVLALAFGDPFVAGAATVVFNLPDQPSLAGARLRVRAGFYLPRERRLQGLASLEAIVRP